MVLPAAGSRRLTDSEEAVLLSIGVSSGSFSSNKSGLLDEVVDRD